MLSLAARSLAISAGIGLIIAAAMWLLRSEPADLMIRRVAVRTRHALPTPGPKGERPLRLPLQGHRLEPIGNSFATVGAIFSWLMNLFFMALPSVAGAGVLCAGCVLVYQHWGSPLLCPAGAAGSHFNPTLFFAALPWGVAAVAAGQLISETLWRISWYGAMAAYPRPYAENSQLAFWAVHAGVLIVACAVSAHSVKAAADREVTQIQAPWAWCAACGFVPPPGADRCPECGIVRGDQRPSVHMIARLGERGERWLGYTAPLLGLLLVLSPWTIAWSRVALRGQSKQDYPPGRATTPLEELRELELRSRAGAAAP